MSTDPKQQTHPETSDKYEALQVATVQMLYKLARDAAHNALLVGRRDINRLSTFSLRLGDDVRAEAEEYIGRLEQIMAILEQVK